MKPFAEYVGPRAYEIYVEKYVHNRKCVDIAEKYHVSYKRVSQIALETKKIKDWYDNPSDIIQDSLLSPRTKNALFFKGVKTFTQASQYGEVYFLRIAQFGVKCLDELKEEMKRRGWYMMYRGPCKRVDV